MTYFLETSGTIPDGLGFEQFDMIHLTWLVIGALIIAANCLLYRKLSETNRTRLE